MAVKHFSPLRYPGGKGKLFGFVRDVIVMNGLEGQAYAEPYAGGAAVAVGLLLEDYVKTISINDIDVGVFSFWNSIVEQTDEFLKLLWDTPVTVEEWAQQKEILRNPTEHSVLEVGFATFFLNRTNRSGVLTGGVIGGLDQLGTYKVDARYNKKTLMNRIVSIGCFSDQIKVSNLDAIRFLKSISRNQRSRTLMFIDPPYLKKGNRLYTNYYRRNDHVAVSEYMKNIYSCPWIVTYDDDPYISQLYSWASGTKYSFRYSVNHSSRQGSELLFHSSNLVLPYVPTMRATA